MRDREELDGTGEIEKKCGLTGSVERIGCEERLGRSEATARSRYSWGRCLFVSRSSLLYFSLIMLWVVTMVRDTGEEGSLLCLGIT